MSAENLMVLAQVLAPAVAAYVAVKVGVAVAMERADNAMQLAKRAHDRIDRLMDADA